MCNGYELTRSVFSDITCDCVAITEDIGEMVLNHTSHPIEYYIMCCRNKLSQAVDVLEIMIFSIKDKTTACPVRVYDDMLLFYYLVINGCVITKLVSQNLHPEETRLSQTIFPVLSVVRKMRA